MKTKKYHFSIDEPQPEIRTPDDFQQLLGRVQTKLPWYSHSGLWIATSSLLISVTAAWMTSAAINRLSLKTKNVKETATQVHMTDSFPTVTESCEGIVSSIPGSKQVNYAFNPDQATAEIEELKIDLSELPYEVSPTKILRQGWIEELTLKFDSVVVHSEKLPGYYPLGIHGHLIIPAGALIHQDGSPCSGTFYILFREFRNTASMISGKISPEINSGSSDIPLLVNGGMEIHLMQGHEELKIRNGFQLIMNYEVIDGSDAYTGFYSSGNSNIFHGMNTEALLTGNASAKNLKDGMMVKRSFWQWISDLFHGRKIKWDTFERKNNNIITSTYSTERTFEIAKTGIFLSGKTFTKQAAIKTVKFHFRNSSFEPVLYQVFTKSNMIRICPVLQGETQIAYYENEPFILLTAPVNTYLAVFADSRKFESQLKSRDNIDIEFDIYSGFIKNTEDLEKLLRR